MKVKQYIIKVEYKPLPDTVKLLEKVYRILLSNSPEKNVDTQPQPEFEEIASKIK